MGIPESWGSLVMEKDVTLRIGDVILDCRVPSTYRSLKEHWEKTTSTSLDVIAN